MKNIILAAIGLGSILALVAYIFITQTNTTSSFVPDSPPSQVQSPEGGTNGETTQNTEDTSTEYAVTALFSDVTADAWYTPYIQRAYKEGLVQGTPEDGFQPDAPLTYGAFSVMIAKAYHGTELTDFKYIFAQEAVADWSIPYIQTLSQLYGSVPQYQEVLVGLNGDSQMTRFLASSLIGMLLTTENVTKNTDYSPTADKFTDLGDLDQTQKSLLGATSQFQVMTGTTETTFQGTTILTRAQACVILCSLLDLSEDNQLLRDDYNEATPPSEFALQSLEGQTQSQQEEAPEPTTTPSVAPTDIPVPTPA